MDGSGEDKIPTHTEPQVMSSSKFFKLLGTFGCSFHGVPSNRTVSVRQCIYAFVGSGFKPGEI